MNESIGATKKRQEALRLIEKRIYNSDLKGYDPSDVLCHPLFNLAQKNGLLYIPLRIVEICAPVACRKLLRIEQQVAPTAFSHVIQGYMKLLGAGVFDNSYLKTRINTLCKEALNCSAVNSRYTCWTHPYSAHAKEWRDDGLKKDTSMPLSCAHNTARVGGAILAAGRGLKRADWIDEGLSAANALVHFHNWRWSTQDSACAVSYYPNTADEVINTSAEVAAFFAHVLEVTGERKFEPYIQGLVKRIIQEQHDDGSWRYCTQMHEEIIGRSSGPDNHHHAMIVRALAEIITRAEQVLDDVDEVAEAIVKGLRFYVSDLSLNSGRCLLFPYSSREANVAGYCEGLMAIRAALPIVDEYDKSLGTVSRSRYSLIRKNFEGKFLAEDGRVYSQRRFGIRYDIGSIRWGSGLAFELLAAEFKDGK